MNKNILNDFSLVNVAAQTSIPKDDFHPEIIVGLLVGKGTSLDFSAVDLASQDAFNTKLKAGMLADADNRLYPIFAFTDFTNNSEKPVIATFGYGGKVFVRDGYPAFNAKMFRGSFQLLAQFRKLNNDTSCKVAFVDQRGNVMLTSGDGVTASGFSIMTLNFNTFTYKSGSEPDSFLCDITLASPQEYNDNQYFVGTGTNLVQTLMGLLPIKIQLDATSTKSALKVILSTSATNLEPIYGTELSGTGKNLWKITKVSDGTDAPITSVAKDDTNDWFTVTPTSALSINTDYELKLVAPATLEAAGVGSDEQGYESIPLIISFAS